MLETAQTRLKTATKEGDPWKMGWTHLEVTSALLQRSTDWLEFQEDAKQALSQADQAIEAFSGIPFPGGIASAHLARASIFTQLADGEENGLKKAEGVERALDACLTAQGALNGEGVHFGQFFDIYSSVCVLLLQLRGMCDAEEYRRQFDNLIAANSTVLGEIVAEDLQLRAEGGSMLITAKLLGALAEIEEDEGEREEILTAQSMLALQAASWLETASDPDLIDQAREEFQQAWDKLEGSAESVPETPDEPGKCPDCGSTKAPGAKFCAECGSQFRGGR